MGLETLELEYDTAANGNRQGSVMGAATGGEPPVASSMIPGRLARMPRMGHIYCVGPALMAAVAARGMRSKSATVMRNCVIR